MYKNNPFFPNYGKLTTSFSKIFPNTYGDNIKNNSATALVVENNDSISLSNPNLANPNINFVNHNQHMTINVMTIDNYSSIASIKNLNDVQLHLNVMHGKSLSLIYPDSFQSQFHITLAPGGVLGVLDQNNVENILFSYTNDANNNISITSDDILSLIGCNSEAP